MFFPWNSWSVPAPQEGIVELRTPPGTGIEPQGQEKMGGKAKFQENCAGKGSPCEKIPKAEVEGQHQPHTVNNILFLCWKQP